MASLPFTLCCPTESNFWDASDFSTGSLWPSQCHLCLTRTIPISSCSNSLNGSLLEIFLVQKICEIFHTIAHLLWLRKLRKSIFAIYTAWMKLWASMWIYPFILTLRNPYYLINSFEHIFPENRKNDSNKLFFLPSSLGKTAKTSRTSGA